YPRQVSPCHSCQRAENLLPGYTLCLRAEPGLPDWLRAYGFPHERAETHRPALYQVLPLATTPSTSRRRGSGFFTHLRASAPITASLIERRVEASHCCISRRAASCLCL